MPDFAPLERRSGEGLRRLERLMAELRGPGGCPWDREQTLDSLRSCLLEETYELLEAMEGEQAGAHLEELGDVLLQVVFQAQIRREEGAFTLDDVANGIADKLVRRHPHVFGRVRVEDASAALHNWEAVKRTEGRNEGGGRPRCPLEGVPRTLPALLRAQRVQAKCEKAGFAWDARTAARPAVAQALDALDAAGAGDPEHTVKALGDLLFALAGLARTLDVDAESALRSATDRFADAFRAREGHA